MLYLVLRRFAASLVTLALVSVVAFIVIALPPGDYADAYAASRIAGGEVVTEADLVVIRHRLGLDKPLYVQYQKWIGGIILEGDFGYSYQYRRPVKEVIGERLPMTIFLAATTMFFIYATAIPLGIYSALHQYSIADYTMGILGYIGLATPNFLLALILMYFGQVWFGTSAGGIFSYEYQDAPWSIEKFLDLLAHLWVPVVVLGTAGMAFQLRTMRATLLDELNEMYVISARATGLSEMKMILTYPVRMALNPIVSTLGWELTRVISGAPIIGVVLALPDTGSLFLNALLNQDMLLAGAIILIFSVLVMIGTLISDILLLILDPRIRLQLGE